MISFIEFIKEETESVDNKKGKLTHLRHLEDHILYDNHEGVARADHHLNEVHKTLLGKKGLTNNSVKFDGCIREDTEVLIFNGVNYSLKTIKEITDAWTLAAGFMVLGMTENNQVISTKILDKNVTSVPKQWLKIEFDNDSHIFVTEDHVFFTDKGEVEAKDLTEEHDIINFSIK